MIDQRDTKTMQLLPLWKGKPGRPKKESGAMTGAERMRKYREKQARERKEEENQNQDQRREANSREAITQYNAEHLKAYSDADLWEAVGIRMAAGRTEESEMYWRELGRRMSWL